MNNTTDKRYSRFLKRVLRSFQPSNSSILEGHESVRWIFRSTRTASQGDIQGKAFRPTSFKTCTYTEIHLTIRYKSRIMRMEGYTSTSGVSYTSFADFELRNELEIREWLLDTIKTMELDIEDVG